MAKLYQPQEGLLASPTRTATTTEPEEVMTTTLVGPEQRMFEAPKEVLCSNSNYFKHAYHAGFQECRENLFRLHDVSQRIFHIFLRWLPSGRFYTEPDDDDSEAFLLGSLGDRFWSEKHTDDDGNDRTYVPKDREEDERWEASSGVNAIGDFEVDEMLADLEIPELEHIIDDCEARWDQPEFVSRLQTLLDEKKSALKNEDGKMKRSKMEMQRQMAEGIEDDTPMRTHSDAQEYYGLLVDLYIFGDRFDVRLLRTKVMSFLQAEQIEHAYSLNGCPLPRYEIVAEVYESLPESSRLRRWIVATSMSTGRLRKYFPAGKNLVSRAVPSETTSLGCIDRSEAILRDERTQMSIHSSIWGDFAIHAVFEWWEIHLHSIACQLLLGI